MRIIVTTVFILIFTFSILSENTSTFKVDVSKEQVKVGEVLKYSISIEVGSKETPKIKLPQFDDFQVISQNTSQQFSYKKERVVLNLRLEYILLAIKEGEFKLPQVLLEYENNTLQSPAKEIQVSGTLPEFKQRQKEKSEESIQDYLEGATSI